MKLEIYLTRELTLNRNNKFNKGENFERVLDVYYKSVAVSIMIIKVL